MTRPAQNHRDPWFNPWFSSILEECKTIFKTKEGTTFIFPGTGTGVKLRSCTSSGRGLLPQGSSDAVHVSTAGCRKMSQCAAAACRRLGVGPDEHAVAGRQNRDLPLRTVLAAVGEGSDSSRTQHQARSCVAFDTTPCSAS